MGVCCEGLGGSGRFGRVWEGLGGLGMYAGGWDAFFLVFREKHENLENVENLLVPACSSSQSQPTHLARDAPSLPAWVEEGFRAHLVGEGLEGVGRYAGAWEGAWKRFSGVWRAYVLRSFVTVLLIYIYMYMVPPHVPTPFLMYVRKCVAHGGGRCKVTKTMIL